MNTVREKLDGAISDNPVILARAEHKPVSQSKMISGLSEIFWKARK